MGAQATPQALLDELCNIVSSFICQPGVQAEIERNVYGQHVFTKGGSQAVCTVKLAHGQVYNMEFVYRFWVYKLQSLKFPFSPVFVIHNNGLALTLKCFMSEPRDSSVWGNYRISMNSDVDLTRNSSVIITHEDFIKFKSAMVYNRDLDVYSSMVVCRTFITDRRQALQFLVVKPKNNQRIRVLLDSIVHDCRGRLGNPDFIKRRPIRASSLSCSSSSSSSSSDGEFEKALVGERPLEGKTKWWVSLRGDGGEKWSQRQTLLSVLAAMMVGMVAGLFVMWRLR